MDAKRAGRCAMAAWCFVGTAAIASPITYEFTVTASDGALAGIVAHGDFTFDSSSITPGAQNAAAGLFTSLNLTWDGIAYTEATANTGSLTFDAGGALIGALFGTQCFPGFCTGSGGTEGWTVSTPLFLYTTTGSEVGFTGTATLAAVPEPAALLLVAAGLAALGVSRRARGSAGRCPPC